MKQRRKWRWLAVVLLVLITGWFLLHQFILPRRLRLITHYLAAVPPLAFTHAGILIPDRNGTVTLRDWDGRQRWQVMLPGAKAWAASPDGHYLAGATIREAHAELYLWHNGQPAWKTTLPVIIKGKAQATIFTLNSGRVFCWTGDRLQVIDNGRVIAMNAKLPLTRDLNNSTLFYQLTADGTALVGSPNFGRLPLLSDILPVVPDSLPGLDYLALAIHGNTVTARRIYCDHKACVQLDGIRFNDGFLVCDDGMIITREGKASQPVGWWPYSKAVHPVDYIPQPANAAVLESDSEPFYSGQEWACALRILQLRNRKIWSFRCHAMPLKASLSENGNVAAVLMLNLPARPPRGVERIYPKIRDIPGMHDLSDRLTYRCQIQLYTSHGRLRACLPLCSTPEIPCYQPVPTRYLIDLFHGHRYDLVSLKLLVDDRQVTVTNIYLSPDGRRLVVEVVPPEKPAEREYLHYRW